jgi:hypothetical protein
MNEMKYMKTGGWDEIFTHESKLENLDSLLW